MTTTETKEHFKVGESVKVYQRPIQQEGFEGIAELIEFVGNYNYESSPVERWKVRFDNEVPIYERIIYKDTSSLLSMSTKMLEEPSAVLQNRSEKEQAGTKNAVENEWESLRALMRKINSAETRENFKVGGRIEVYRRPTQQEDFEGIAELIEFKHTSSLLPKRTKMLEEPSAVLQNCSGKKQTGTKNTVENEWESLRTLVRKINSA